MFHGDYGTQGIVSRHQDVVAVMPALLAPVLPGCTTQKKPANSVVAQTIGLTMAACAILRVCRLRGLTAQQDPAPGWAPASFRTSFWCAGRPPTGPELPSLPPAGPNMSSHELIELTWDILDTAVRGMEDAGAAAQFCLAIVECP